MRNSDPFTVHDLPKNPPPAAPAAIAPVEPTPPPAPAPDAPPAPEAKPEPAPKATPATTLKEGREEARKQVMSKIFGIDPDLAPPKSPKAPKEDKPADDAPAAATPAPDAAPADKPAPKKPRKVAPKPEIDAEAITAAATSAATKAVVDAQRANPPTAPAPDATPAKPDISVLAEEDREAVPVFEKMEQMNPAKYKGLVGKLVDYEKKQGDYVAQWEKDHPGETFDPEDSAHDGWYEKNKPKWTEMDFGRALAKLEAEPLEQKLAKYERDQLENQERSARMDRVKPELEHATSAVPKLIAESIDPEFGDVDKLKSDPLALEIVQRATAHVQGDLNQLASILASTVKYDDNNPAHKRVLDAAVNLEQEVLSLDPGDRVRDGKAFATREQWFQMTPQQQQRHWCPEFQDIAGYMARKTAEFAKNVHQNELKRIEQLGYVKNGAPKPAPKANGEPSPKPQPEQRMAPSPTHAPGAVAPASTANGSGKKAGWKEAFGFA